MISLALHGMLGVRTRIDTTMALEARFPIACKDTAHRYGSAAARWRATLARDAAADAHFVYAVRTTGIYCRPSCAARKPRRDGVEFFARAADAERAGFRACLRCRPGGQSGGEAMHARMINACRALAAEHVDLDRVAAKAGLSRSHFQRTFKAAIGTTPQAYAASRRNQRLRLALRTERTATDAAYAAGFNAPSRFYAAASRQLGMTPRAWRQGGAGETIRFAIGTCSLGLVLVGATERGVCAMLLGDDASALLAEFQTLFAKAELIGDDSGFAKTLTDAIALIEAPSAAVELPLDIAGTLFQQKVWAALRDIPPGTTLSYAELAARIGAPKAVRAVGRACAANRIAVAIPCHRIVRADGDLSGYRWGVARKAELLKRETTTQDQR